MQLVHHRRPSRPSRPLPRPSTVTTTPSPPTRADSHYVRARAATPRLANRHRGIIRIPRIRIRAPGNRHMHQPSIRRVCPPIPEIGSTRRSRCRIRLTRHRQCWYWSSRCIRWQRGCIGEQPDFGRWPSEAGQTGDFSNSVDDSRTDLGTAKRSTARDKAVAGGAHACALAFGSPWIGECPTFL